MSVQESATAPCGTEKAEEKEKVPGPMTMTTSLPEGQERETSCRVQKNRGTHEPNSLERQRGKDAEATETKEGRWGRIREHPLQDRSRKAQFPQKAATVRG